MSSLIRDVGPSIISIASEGQKIRIRIRIELIFKFKDKGPY